MTHARSTAVIAVAMLVAGCAPADGAPPAPPAPTPVASATPTTSKPASPTPSPSPLLSPTRTPDPTSQPSPSVPVSFPIRTPLLDGGAAIAVSELHEVSGLRPALKLDISEAEVTLTVLAMDMQPRSYRWRDGIIDLAETDVQYLRQTTFWPTDFALDNVGQCQNVLDAVAAAINCKCPH